MTDRVRLVRRLCAERGEHIAVGAIGRIWTKGYPYFIWLGHGRDGPYTWASKGKPSRAVLVAFERGQRWCWPEELIAA